MYAFSKTLHRDIMLADNAITSCTGCFLKSCNSFLRIISPMTVIVERKSYSKLNGPLTII